MPRSAEGHKTSRLTDLRAGGLLVEIRRPDSRARAPQSFFDKPFAWHFVCHSVRVADADEDARLSSYRLSHDFTNVECTRRRLQWVARSAIAATSSTEPRDALVAFFVHHLCSSVIAFDIRTRTLESAGKQGDDRQAWG